MAKVWKQLQRSDSPFAGTVTGNVSGTVDGVAVATIKSGAASGATANQDTTSNIRAGVTAANVGLENVPNYSAATMRAGVTKADVGLDNVANESRATILGGTFTGDVGGTSASDLRTKAIAGSAAKDAVDGNAAVTMVGGSINIGSGEWTVDSSGNQVVNGTVVINKETGGTESGLTMNSGSSGDMKFLMQGANPAIDMGGTSPLGASTLYIRRSGTGTQSRIFFCDGTTAKGCIGFANQPSSLNTQFAMHTAAIYDNSSPYTVRNFTMDADNKIGFWQNDKSFSGLTIGSDGTNKGLYIKDGGLSVGTTFTTDGFIQLADTYGLCWGGTTRNRIDGHDGNNTVDIYTDNVKAFGVDSSQNATFAGDITMTGTRSLKATNDLKLYADGIKMCDFWLSGSDEYVHFTGTTRTTDKFDQTGTATNTFGGGATFDGDVEADDFSFSGQGKGIWSNSNGVGNGDIGLWQNDDQVSLDLGDAGGFAGDVHIYTDGGLNTTFSQHNISTVPIGCTKLSVGTSTMGSTGEIRATNEITAYYSDDRLKTKSGNIENALEKVVSLNGFHYKANELAGELGYDTSVKKVGVSAQEVLKVLPEAVVPAPIDPKYHTVQYNKLIPLLIESIKELTDKVRKLENGST